jgi:hypothetical protein
MKRSAATPHVLTTIALVALGAAPTCAQADGIAQAAPRVCQVRDRDAPVRIPDSIHAPSDLRRRMEVMLQNSPTFRLQCRRIARAPQLYVRINFDVGVTGRPYRAMTKICRYQSGAIVAEIGIAALGDPDEWVAHEFEHLIEQLDGVNLRELERRRQGAWHSGDRIFETERAIRVGRRVVDEMRKRLATVDLAGFGEQAMFPEGRHILPSVP